MCIEIYVLINQYMFTLGWVTLDFADTILCLNKGTYCTNIALYIVKSIYSMYKIMVLAFPSSERVSQTEATRVCIKLNDTA